MARNRITQTQMAASLGKSQQWVSSRLNAHVSFTVDEITDVADVLGVPALSLLSEAAA